MMPDGFGGFSHETIKQVKDWCQQMMASYMWANTYQKAAKEYLSIMPAWAWQTDESYLLTLISEGKYELC